MPNDYELRIPSTLLGLFKACEVNCAAGCCGKDAFQISPEPILAWIQQQGVHAGRGAVIQLDRLIAEIGTQDDIVASEHFNAWWEPDGASAYFGHWKQMLVGALASHQGTRSKR